MITFVQSLLKATFLYDGQVDGVMGRLTRRALWRTGVISFMLWMSVVQIRLGNFKLKKLIPFK